MFLLSKLFQGFRDRFLNIDGLFILLRFPAYGLALASLCVPAAAEVLDETLRGLVAFPENIGFLVVVIAFDRCTAPLVEKLTNPVTRHAKEALREEERKRELENRRRVKAWARLDPKEAGDASGMDR